MTMFRFPQYRLYPMDCVCDEILRALAQKNWSVSNIQIEFDSFTHPEHGKCKCVTAIEGPDFLLRFYRPGNPARPDAGCVSDVVIPGKHLAVYQDFSGPHFWLYVGNNWEADRYSFTHGSKSNSKLFKEPRTYLLYKGSADQSELTYGGRYGSLLPFLTHDNNLYREYDPEGAEPRYFHTRQVLDEVTDWLRANVLPRVK